MILNEEDLVRFCNECKQESKKIVLASGVFDILHVGHLKFLEKAQEFGDILIVGINNDTYTRRKGVSRPIQNERTRAFLIAGFECVDCVHIFDNESPNISLLKLVKPDILIISSPSSDKPKDRTRHFDIMKKSGGKVIVMDKIFNLHSSNLIKKLMMEYEI